MFLLFRDSIGSKKKFPLTLKKNVLNSQKIFLYKKIIYLSIYKEIILIKQQIYVFKLVK